MIGLFAATDAGRRAAAELAVRLGPDAAVVDGPVGPALRRMWPRLDSAVLFSSASTAVRLVAPLLRDEHADPGVVCVDETLRFAVALAGSRSGAADAVAEQVAEVLGCEPVVTTTEATAETPLDGLVELLGARVDGDLVSCGSAVLSGSPVRLVNPLGFPLPALPDNVGPDIDNPVWTIVVDDRRPDTEETGRTLRLVPATLAVGIGVASGVSRTAVTEVLARLDGEYGLDPRAVGVCATIEARADEPAVLDAVQDLGFWNSPDAEELPLMRYDPATLAAVEVPNPSDRTRAETGTPSVAEAAALRAARETGGGADTELVVHKTKGAGVTVAAARVRPRGRLAVIDIGPGEPDQRTPRAEIELLRSAVVFGTACHLDRVRHLVRPGTEIRQCSSAVDGSVPEEALEQAGSGRAVAVIGSAETGVPAAASAARKQLGTGVEFVAVPGARSVDAWLACGSSDGRAAR